MCYYEMHDIVVVDSSDESVVMKKRMKVKRRIEFNKLMNNFLLSFLVR